MSSVDLASSGEEAAMNAAETKDYGSNHSCERTGSKDSQTGQMHEEDTNPSGNHDLEKGINDKATSNEEVSCGICWEDFTGTPDAPGLDVERLECHHTFCRGCLRMHVENSVSMKQMPILCPQDSCEEPMSLDWIQSILPAHEYHRFWKQHCLQTDPDAHECPHCGTVVSIQACRVVSEDEQQENDLKCGHCEKAFCLLHGAMHPSLRCTDYLQTPQGRALAESERILDLHTKKCSRCGCRLQKKTGCDHVFCGHCHQDMCWHCGTHEYLTGTGRIRTCTGCNQKHINPRYIISVERHPVLEGLWTLLRYLWLVAVVVLWMLFAAVFAILTCCFCGCFGGGRWVRLEKKSHGTFLHGFAATIAIIILPVGIFLYDRGMFDFEVVHDIFGFDGEIPFLETETTEEPTDSNREDDSV